MFLRKDVFLLPSLAACAILGGSLSAVAQTVDTVSNQSLTQTNTTFSVAQVPQFPDPVTKATPNPILTPVPGTVATSSAALTSGSAESTTQPATNQVAQSDISVGRSTRGGSSYIGVAGNIGVAGGDSSLGDGNFAFISKVGLTNAISVRPSAVLGDDATILVPITYDFTFQQTGDPFSEPLPIAPYVGVGAAIKTGDNSKVAVLATAGIDVPLNAQFTATAAVNAGFFDQTDVGLLLGVGYNFGGF
jgi:hypothetical protein